MHSFIHLFKNDHPSQTRHYSALGLADIITTQRSEARKYFRVKLK